RLLAWLPHRDHPGGEPVGPTPRESRLFWEIALRRPLEPPPPPPAYPRPGGSELNQWLPWDHSPRRERTGRRPRRTALSAKVSALRPLGRRLAQCHRPGRQAARQFAIAIASQLPRP